MERRIDIIKEEQQKMAVLSGYGEREGALMTIRKKMNFKFMEFIRRLLKKETKKDEISLTQVVTKELDVLWQLFEELPDKDEDYKEECVEKLRESFMAMSGKYTKKALDDVYFWPRYVRAEVKIAREPIPEFIDYVSEENYISLCQKLDGIKHAVIKKKDTTMTENMDRFFAAFYLHVINDIDPQDVPSILALGKMEERSKNYGRAEEWYSRLTNGDNPSKSFSGVTSLAACYEKETKELFLQNKKLPSPEKQKRIKEINEKECALYEKWEAIIKQRIEAGEVSEELLENYTQLLVGYARFERKRHNFKKAYDILMKQIPENAPEQYRKYSELAMLFQNRGPRNPYYSLERSIEYFKHASECIDLEKIDDKSGKSRKSILVPLANTYFQTAQYDDCKNTCAKVLQIDRDEKNAKDLLARLEKLVS